MNNFYNYVIPQFPPDWGFANRMLFYNNLRQISAKRKYNWCSVSWDGYRHFDGDLLGKVRESKHLPMLSTISVLDPCLGEYFFQWRTIPTREIFKLKEPIQISEKTSAIHFRGTDFFGWNPSAVLNSEYYMNSVKEIEEEVEKFILFTDDENLPSYQKVKSYFDSNKINYSVGQNTNNRSNYIGDFKLMSECDYIISSPSTYCICAGFIGKEKKIIHSETWLNNRKNTGDKFWVDLYNGGNNDYKLWRMI